MKKVINLLIFIAILLAPLSAKNVSAKNLSTKNAKNQGQKAQNTQLNNAFSDLRKCAYNDISSCEKLLNAGISSANECELNECALIGAVLMMANKDEQAIAYLKRACALQILSACKNMGIIFENMNNFNNAKAYYNDGCKFGDTLSCHNLGLLYTSKLENTALALDSFKLACGKFYAKSCFNLGVLHAKNASMESKSKAKYYFDKACDLGLNAGCNALKTYANTPMPTLQKHRGLYVKSID